MIGRVDEDCERTADSRYTNLAGYDVQSYGPLIGWEDND